MVSTGSPGEQRCAFGHREQIAGEAEVAQVVEELRADLAELREAAEIIDFLGGETAD